MTLNGAMTVILRYLTDFGGFCSQPRQSGWR